MGISRTYVKASNPLCQSKSYSYQPWLSWQIFQQPGGLIVWHIFNANLSSQLVLFPRSENEDTLLSDRTTIEHNIFLQPAYTHNPPRRRDFPSAQWARGLQPPAESLAEGTILSDWDNLLPPSIPPSARSSFGGKCSKNSPTAPPRTRTDNGRVSWQIAYRYHPVPQRPHGSHFQVYGGAASVTAIPWRVSWFSFWELKT